MLHSPEHVLLCLQRSGTLEVTDDALTCPARCPGHWYRFRLP